MRKSRSYTRTPERINRAADRVKTAKRSRTQQPAPPGSRTKNARRDQEQKNYRDKNAQRIAAGAGYKIVIKYLRIGSAPGDSKTNKIYHFYIYQNKSYNAFIILCFNTCYMFRFLFLYDFTSVIKRQLHTPFFNGRYIRPPPRSRRAACTIKFYARACMHTYALLMYNQ